jgi:O-6-methylguanine DNA methyltransferase
VAGANGENGIAIIIPCHRIIGTNGSLTGYGGGLPIKKWLLEHEWKHSGKSAQGELFG